jgi:hypothetical protein
MEECNESPTAPLPLGGALGKKTYLRAVDLVLPHERVLCNNGIYRKEAIVEITSKRLRCGGFNEQEEIVVSLPMEM